MFKSISATGGSYGNDIAVDGQGDVFTVGSFEGSAFGLTSQQYSDIFVWKGNREFGILPLETTNDSYSTSTDTPLSVSRRVCSRMMPIRIMRP